jgi:peroxiredoxin
MVVAVVVVWGSVRRPQVPGTLPIDHALGLAVVAIIGAMLVWLIGQVRVLRRQVDRQALSMLGAEGMPIGSVAPEFELADSHGGTTSLQQLLTCGTSVVLVFVHPGCDICATPAGELPRWQQRLRDWLTIAVIANGDVTENLAWGRERGLGEIPILVQQGNEAAALRYRVRGTPSAVLVDANGRIAGPVARGPIAIRELFVSARNTKRGEGSRFPHPTGR